MEKQLRASYLQWVSTLPRSRNLLKSIERFHIKSLKIINDLGGAASSLGALAGFPAPTQLDLDPVAGYIYNEMQTAAIQAGISIGLNAKLQARAMLQAGMDKSYRKLERLARTEVVRAYWKNAFDSIAGLDDLVMVWGAEDGPRTCEWCKERDGMVITSEVKDHPNGRCTPIPMLRTRVHYKGSVLPDGTIFMDPEWSHDKAVLTPRGKPPSQLAVSVAQDP